MWLMARMVTRAEVPFAVLAETFHSVATFTW